MKYQQFTTNYVLQIQQEMSKRKASKLSSSLDLSNHSTADILASPSERYFCHICKETDTSDDLVELCQCDNLVHQQCMTKVIDDWIVHQQNQNNQTKTTDQKPYMCKSCHTQVFYRSKKQMICRNCSQICYLIRKSPFQSFFQILFFCLGLYGFIFGILIKTKQYCLQIGVSPITISAMAIALMIISLLMLLISFYYIFIDILTDKRRKVQKVYQRSKKVQKKSGNLLTVIQLS